MDDDDDGIGDGDGDGVDDTGRGTIRKFHSATREAVAEEEPPAAVVAAAAMTKAIRREANPGRCTSSSGPEQMAQQPAQQLAQQEKWFQAR